MLTKFSVKKPFTVVVMVVIVLILGVVSYVNTSVDLFPNMNMPYVVVATVSIGSSPEAVEENVTVPTEQQLATLDGVKNITSYSMENVSMVLLEFNSGTDIDNVIPLIREALELGDITSKVSGATSSLSGGNSVSDMTSGLKISPIIMKINPSMMPVAMIAVGQDGKTSQESNATVNQLITEMKSISGVASVSTSGMVEDLILMQLSTSHLAADLVSQIIGINSSASFSEGDSEGLTDLVSGITDMLTPELLNTLIAAQNLEMPAGSVTEDGISYFIKVGENIKTRDDLYNTPLLGVNVGAVVSALDAEGEGKLTFAKQVSFSKERVKSAFATIPILKDTMIDGIVNGLFTNMDENDGSGEQLFFKEEIGGAEYLTVLKGGVGESVEVGWTMLSNILKGRSLTIKLGNITDIFELDTSGKVLTSLNGMPTVTLTVSKQPDYSTADVSTEINKLLEKYASDEGSEGFFYVSLFDQGFYINEVIKSLISNMLMGAAFAVVILFVFIRRIKPTLLVALSIAISVVATFVLMYFAGITLNILSMGGLALGVGMLVDNSIVVIENIYRQRSQGKSSVAAAIDGTKQVAGAIIASTLTTAIVFLPLVFVKGMVKELFVDMAATIAFSLVASLFVSITLVPMVTTTKLFKGEQAADIKWMEKLKRLYEKCINFVLDKKRQWIVIATVIVLFATSVVSVFFMGMEIFPTGDTGSLSMALEFNMDKFGEDDDYRDISEDTVTFINNKIMSLDYVETVGISESYGLLSTVVGDMGSDVFSSTSTKLTGYILLKDKRKVSDSEAAEEINKLIQSQNGLYEVDVKKDDSNSSITSLLGNSIDIQIYCEDLSDLTAATQTILDKVKGVQGLGEITSSLDNATLEYKLILDKDKASQYGVYVGSALLAVMNGLSDNSVTTDIKFKGDTQSTSVSVYPSTYTISHWIKSVDAAGGKVNIFFNADDSVYILNSSAEAVTLFGGDEVAVGGKIAVALKDGLYSYKKADGTVVSFTPNANGKNYFSIDSNTTFNLVTMPISIADLSNMSGVMSGGGVGETVPLWTLLDDSCFIKGDDGKTLMIQDPNGAVGEMIPYGIQKTAAQVTILRDNKNRYTTISAEIAEGNNVGDATKAITAAIAAASLPDGVTYEFGGQSEMVDTIFDSVYLILVLGIVLIYLVMVAQFQSLKSPFIVMFTIPLAFTGSILGLLISGMNLSASAMLGLVVLVGIVVNNGIVFVDYTNKLVDSGMPVKEALVKTGTDRLRPILMTALTTIFGMASMAFDFTEMGAMIRPMAVAAMGGLAYATLVTLFFVPILYYAFNKNRKAKDVVEEYMVADLAVAGIDVSNLVIEKDDELTPKAETFAEAPVLEAASTGATDNACDGQSDKE